MSLKNTYGSFIDSMPPTNWLNIPHDEWIQGLKSDISRLEWQITNDWKDLDKGLRDSLIRWAQKQIKLIKIALNNEEA